MLNLYKSYYKNFKSKYINSTKISSTKNFPSSVREWNNIIYLFNKNNLNLVLESGKISFKLIKSYFNLYNNKLELKLKKINLRKRFKRLSSNKIYVSNGVYKHTNDKVIITLYIYNRQKVNISFLINNKFENFIIKTMIKNLLLFKYKINDFLKKTNKNKFIVFNIIKDNNNYINLKNQFNSLISNYYDVKLYNKILKKVLKKYKNYFFYKQILFINKSKFNYNYLYHLTYLLKNIYNKNVEFNIINLKNFFLNSYILTESLLLKIKRNRKKLNKKLKLLLLNTNVIYINKFLTLDSKNKIRKTKENNFVDSLIYNNSIKVNKSIKKTALDLLKHKRVTGIRIEAKGRLTKRYTASRSIFILKSKGNLIDIDSSYLGLSTVFLKGNIKSNLHYTKLSSKTRIGSFGLKGWVSGY